MFGQHLVVPLVPAADLAGRVAERFEQRHALVLVHVRLVEREGVDEKAAEVGPLAFARGARGRHDDAPLARDRGHEPAAGARRVHDRHGLGRERVEPHRERVRGQVRAGQAEARLLAAAAPVAEQEDERHVRGPRPVRHREHFPLHRFQGGPVRDAGGQRRILREPSDGLANAEAAIERVEQRLGFRPELLGVLRRAPEAGDDEHMGPRRGGPLNRGSVAGRRAGAEEQRRDEHRGDRSEPRAPGHARSFRRR